MAAAVEANPGGRAVVFADASATRGQLDYAELDARSTRLARALIERGVGPEDLVAVGIPRSIESVVAVWAVAKSGAGFVPIDPNYPADRVQHMVKDSGVVTGLTVTAAAETLPGQVDWLVIDDEAGARLREQYSAEPITFADRVRQLRADHPAYVIYTSGSTGLPKGVVVTQAGLSSFCDEQRERYRLTPDSRTLHFASPSFDASVLELLLALGGAGTMVVAAPTVYGGDELATLLRREGVTHAFITPAALASVDPSGLDELRVVVAGGEACPPDLVRRWVRPVTDGTREFFNGYGPTETTIMTNISAPLSPQDTVTIGGPIRAVTEYVLDERLTSVPTGVAGELYITGAQLARGYHERPGLTAQRFVANPFADNGSRLYRTGDLVRWTADGDLEYLGRNDFQVKIRGFRIELGEIDAVLGRHESVDFAVTIGHRLDTGATILAAYVHPADGAEVDTDALLAFASNSLPAHMVPTSITVLDEIPLTPVGKLDRRALPTPRLQTTAFREPSGWAEQLVAEVFAELLGTEAPIGADDDFFELGGNSLIATQAVSRLGAALDVRVPVRVLFETPTVGALAAAVESQTHGRRTVDLGSIPRPPQLPLSLAQRRMWFLNRFDQDAAVGSSAYNLPFALRLTGALDVDALGAALADVVARHEVLRTVYPETPDGPVQVILPPGEGAPVLRVRSVPEAEVPGAVYALASTPFDVTDEVPLRAVLLRVRETDAVDRTAADEVSDSAGTTAAGAGEPAAGGSTGAEPGTYVLAVVVHHIAGDASSMAPLVRDVMIAYAARAAGVAPEWEPLRVQYADYALWQREVLGAEDDANSVAAQQIAFWREHLAGLPDVLDLPTDRPRPAIASMAGGKVPVTIDAETHAGLAALAREHNATLFMVVHTAFAVLLARLSGSGDIAIGTPVAGRGERELDDLIGMFVNTVVFRTRLDGGESFADLLTRQRDADLHAFAHADIPFERLVEVLNPPRSTAHHPLFQVGLSFQNVARAELELPGLTVSGVDADLDVSQFDLHLIVGDSYDESGTPQGIGGFFTYATDLFDEATVRGFADRLGRVLAAVVARPDAVVGEIELLDAVEREQVTRWWNATDHSLADETPTLASILDAAVTAEPDRVAVVADRSSVHTLSPDRAGASAGSEGAAETSPNSADSARSEVGGEPAEPASGVATLTYRELDERVNRLARYLIERGVGPEERVALALRRSIDLVVAMYAVSRAGGAYVPVDPDQPAERTNYILATAEPVCVLTNAEAGFDSVASVISLDEVELAGFSAAPVTDRDRLAALRPEHTAYVIFTSGSTGRPKGVAVSHRAIVNQLRWKTAEFGLTADDAVLLKTAATFDLSVWEFWSAAACAGRLVIAAPDGHRDPAYLAELMAEQRVSTLHAVPSMLDALVTAGLPDSLRRVLAIGEALPAALAQRVLRERPAVELFNLYGPTEAAVSITAHRVTLADQVSVPIGAPEWNSRGYVLDARLRPVPPGVTGELYLAGTQLARAYVARPDLTAERFVANPFEPAARMYRTGDLAAWTGDGELEYRGRTDFQVKIRGFRIELGEIEAALLELPGVAQAAVVAKSEARTGDRLVAYLVPDSDADDSRHRAHGSTSTAVDVSAVKSALAAALPSYMVPSVFVVLDALPLTVNGKLDRKALPEPEFEAREFRAPSTATEEIVAGVFADVLGAEQVGADDDFFALGGNSLLATQVAARLGAALDTRVPVRALFEAATVAGLAANLAQYAGSGRRALTPMPRPEHLPLSPAQQRMWFLNQFDTSSSVYNIPAAIRLTGALDTEALAAAITDLVARHEILCTTYPQTDDGPIQAVADAAPVTLTIRTVAESGIAEAVREVAAAGFDVTRELPFRTALLRITSTDHVLVFVAHHISADGWSMGPLTRDLMLAYTARSGGSEPQWTPLPVQYADYSLWQREILGDEADPDSLIATQTEYWRTALAGLPEELPLPADRPRPAVASYRGETFAVDLDAELHAALERVAAAHDATLFMVVHAALAVLLARLSGTSDIAVGTPVAGRGEAELDELIGMFVNTLVLRTEVDSGAGFDAVLREVRGTDVAAFGHADVPFERLVELLEPVRSTARHPLFQVMLTFQNLGRTELALPGLTVSAVDLDVAVAKFDLQVTMAERPDGSGMSAVFTYATDLFDAATVRSFADRFQRILTAVAADASTVIGGIDLLAPGERERVLHAWNAPGAWVPGTTLPALIAEQAWRRPEAVAIRAGAVTLTFAELQRRANRVARALIARGAGPETLVAVAVERTEDLPVALLGVLATGAAYLPIDATYPAQRLEFMLDDAAPVCVLTTAADRDRVPVGEREVVLLEDTAVYSDARIDDVDRIAALRPDNLAYVIYTSGSTGVPKGVGVTHRNVVELFANTQPLFGFGPADVWTLFHSYAFDFSVWELWCALTHGGSVVVVDYLTSRSPEQLRELLIRERVTVLNQTPSAFYQLAEADRDADGELALRYVIFGGEALDARRLSRWYERHPMDVPRLVNMYGITETTVHVSFLSLDEHTADRPGLIGRALPGLDARVLDDRLHPAPVGVPGEIHISGAQLTRGYLGRPGLTATRFVADPFGAPGSRMYRTGDVGRWRDAPASLEYAGRSDQQVQLRGFRIELGEIEAALLRCPGVGHAVAMVRTDAVAGERLIGYVVPAADAALDAARLRGQVGEFLTGYMVPDAFVVLDALPLTPNGKLDRRALPEPEFTGAAAFRAPETELERTVAEVFADLTGATRVGLDDDFFALGGNSLLATRAVARLRAATGVPVAVQWLFTDATVAGLATRLHAPAAELDAGAALDVLLPLRAEGEAEPLFCVHPMYGLAWSYAGLAGHMPDGVPLYGLQSPALSGEGELPETLAELAHRYLTEIRTVQPHGPYRLLGWSLGGVLAHAIATELQAAGEQVSLLAMLDSHPDPDVAGFRAAVREALSELGLGTDVLGDGDDIYDLSDEALATLHAMIPSELLALTPERLRRVYRGAVRSAELISGYRPGVFDGTVEYFSASVPHPRQLTGGPRAADWQRYVSGSVVDHPVPVNHDQMTAPAALEVIGPRLAALLDPAD
nr:non-ribosomal peptide synthetase [Nocardia cyriacigeorgica]